MNWNKATSKSTTTRSLKKGLLLGVDNTGHVTIEPRLVNLSFIVFLVLLSFCSILFYILTVSLTPKRSQKNLSFEKANKISKSNKK